MSLVGLPFTTNSKSPHRSNIEFDAVMFERALKACLAGSSWQAALRVLKDMHSVGVTPSCLAYNMAMEVCRCNSSDHFQNFANEEGPVRR